MNGKSEKEKQMECTCTQQQAEQREGKGRMGRRQHHSTAVHTCTANKYAELTVSRFEHVIVSSSVARARADLARDGARDEC